MKDFSCTAFILSDYLKMWFTEAKANWEGYKNCCTKWQVLQETAITADDHLDLCQKWVSRLMSYEEWADTHTQPDAADKVEFTIDEYSKEDVMEWLMKRTYKFQSADAYVDQYWTGVQRSYYD